MWKIQILLCGTVQNFFQIFSLYSWLNPQTWRTPRYRESDCIPFAPAGPLLGACLRGVKSSILQNLPSNVHSSGIHIAKHRPKRHRQVDR